MNANGPAVKAVNLIDFTACYGLFINVTYLLPYLIF